MIQYDSLQHLPTAEELPDSDDTPVDNELQILVASLLADILAQVWAERQDWFFGINMGVYFDPQKPAIVPDGFLSLGVERMPRLGGRLSYLLWQEGIPPLLAVEFVSQTYGNEYESKKDIYAAIEVLYYVIYNPEQVKGRQHLPFELYRLVDGEYVLQSGEPYWMPEVGLGIGRGEGTYRAWKREWLYWYDQQGNRFLSSQEVAQQERQRATQEQQLRSDLIAKLRARGIDPDTL